MRGKEKWRSPRRQAAKMQRKSTLPLAPPRISVSSQTMSANEELKESLKRLRDELSGGKPLSADQRKQLENVLSDISRMFEGDPDKWLPAACRP